MPKTGHFEPHVATVRELIKEVREQDPSASSLRSWGEKLRKETGYRVLHKQISRYEDVTHPALDVGYVIAVAMAGGVEIVLGANPRIIRGGIEGKADDFLRSLRTAAAAEPALDRADVERIRTEISRKVIQPLRLLG